jgi:hypothetical protein
LPSCSGESGAPEALAEYRTNLLVPGNHVSSQKRDPASYLVETGSPTKLAMRPDVFGGGHKTGGELQCFVGGHARHQEDPSERLPLFYLFSSDLEIRCTLRKRHEMLVCSKML